MYNLWKYIQILKLTGKKEHEGDQLINLLDLQIKFNEVLKKKLTIEEFEQWVYVTPEIAEHYGHALYLELISLDFKGKYIDLDLEQLLTPVMPFGELEYRIIKEELELVASDTNDIDKVLDNIYENYCDGYSFLRFLGLSFALLGGSNGTLIINEGVRELLREEAKRLLRFIEVDKIRITGMFEYDDFRDSEYRIELTNVELMLRKLEEKIQEK
ncbi:hypothetical protein BBR47_35920 [Brevibacillus brevis NBRC 100599]|uniref:Uncharacterized protein n=1 Tax=Brevibacillus brevis (strain 47 / JCM 6285 / NBRC 100599) TaxID=358681 RepID=C0ZFL0_BREBN|nr:hypothetical protein [Brevibacillus brevis]BAH44569.1 hypothetical protein BBR47_35920 [Brevibacillus brevis NBRC 100599]